ncbi:hypothetical protein L484_012254 [Morus notabilis]|uniref:Uncharacterized protein n=1 Tax=Morus notabilis TaxID=981085 RepID=W9RA67_9ROSA|nr:hypothetical protein L484_012254 [Morus notabilis]
MVEFDGRIKGCAEVIPSVQCWNARKKNDQPLRLFAALLAGFDYKSFEWRRRSRTPAAAKLAQRNDTGGRPRRTRHFGAGCCCGLASAAGCGCCCVLMLAVGRWWGLPRIGIGG